MGKFLLLFIKLIYKRIKIYAKFIPKFTVHDIQNQTWIVDSHFSITILKHKVGAAQPLTSRSEIVSDK